MFSRVRVAVDYGSHGLHSGYRRLASRLAPAGLRFTNRPDAPPVSHGGGVPWHASRRPGATRCALPWTFGTYPAHGLRVTLARRVAGADTVSACIPVRASASVELSTCTPSWRRTYPVQSCGTYHRVRFASRGSRRIAPCVPPSVPSDLTYGTTARGVRVYPIRLHSTCVYGIGPDRRAGPVCDTQPTHDTRPTHETHHAHDTTRRSLHTASIMRRAAGYTL